MHLPVAQTVELRRATAEDEGLLTPLLAGFFSEEGARPYSLAGLGGDECITDITRSKLLSEDHGNHLILVNDEVIGFIDFYTMNVPTCEISTIFIAKEFQRQGYGRQALAQVRDQLAALGYSDVRFEIHSSNVASLALFTSVFGAPEIVTTFYRSVGAANA